MATKTLTIDTDEWTYPDSTGVTHVVTDAETLTFEMTDISATGATYRMDGGSVKCTDGSRIYVKRGETISYNIFPKDALQGTAERQCPGEWIMIDPYNGIEQRWKPSSFNVNDVDIPTSITATFEDQFGNTFTWTTVTVA